MSEDADELLDIDGLCRHLGGNRPLNPATIYRAIKAGSLPKAIAITPGVRRWRRSEVDRMIAARAAERDAAA